MFFFFAAPDFQLAVAVKGETILPPPVVRPKPMRNKRNRKRRLSVQNLETRKLFAADVGFGDMSHGSDAPAEIGSVRPGKVERPTFGPLDDGCPACDFENQAEASTTTEPTNVERPVFGPHIMTFDSVLAEQLGGSANPGGDYI